MANNLQVVERKIASVNPATGEVLGELDCAGEHEIEAAVARARQAQALWAEVGLRKRIEILRDFSGDCTRGKLRSRPPLRARRESRWRRRWSQRSSWCSTQRGSSSTTHGAVADEPVPHGNLATS